MKSLGIFNIFSLILLTLLLLVLPFLTSFDQNFKSAQSMDTFFKNSRVYDNVSTIIKLEVQSKYPEVIKNNVIITSLLNKLVDAVVTPTIVSEVAKPTLKVALFVANSDTSIVNNKVVLATSSYKQQAVAAFNDLGLPQIVNANVDLLINSIPQSITLVDLTKNPNSPLGYLIKLHSLYLQNQFVLGMLWWILAVIVLGIILYNIVEVKKIFTVFWIGSFLSASIIFLLYWLLPTLLSSFLPQATTDVAYAQNTLVIDVITYIVKGVSNTAILYGVFAVFMFAIWKFVDFDKAQDNTDNILKKINIPVFSIKVRKKKIA